MKTKTTIIICAALTLPSLPAHADCVVGQKTAEHAVVLDSNTLVLFGGVAGHTLIHSLTPLVQGVPFSVAKDSFCDYDQSAVYMGTIPLTLGTLKHLD